MRMNEERLNSKPLLQLSFNLINLAIKRAELAAIERLAEEKRLQESMQAMLLSEGVSNQMASQAVLRGVVPMMMNNFPYNKNAGAGGGAATNSASRGGGVGVGSRARLGQGLAAGSKSHLAAGSKTHLAAGSKSHLAAGSKTHLATGSKAYLGPSGGVGGGGGGGGDGSRAVLMHKVMTHLALQSQSPSKAAVGFASGMHAR